MEGSLPVKSIQEKDLLEPEDDVGVDMEGHLACSKMILSDEKQAYWEIK